MLSDHVSQHLKDHVDFTVLVEYFLIVTLQGLISETLKDILLLSPLRDLWFGAIL